LSTTAPTVVVGARVAPHYRDQLARIADRNASTISRTAARLLAERLDDLSTERSDASDVDAR
jgi:hypothetical protein